MRSAKLLCSLKHDHGNTSNKSWRRRRPASRSKWASQTKTRHTRGEHHNKTKCCDAFPSPGRSDALPSFSEGRHKCLTPSLTIPPTAIDQT